MENSVLAIIRDLPTSQAEIDKFSDLIIAEVREGRANALEMHVQFKAIEKAGERITKELASDSLKEANLYPEQNIDLYGAKISKAPVSTKYDYSKCGDQKLLDLQMQLEAAKKAVDDRQAFLKTVPYTGLDIISEDGEAVKIYAPSKIQVDGLKISFK